MLWISWLANSLSQECIKIGPLVRANGDWIAHPFPAQLGPLPLYRDDDGFYSVLGPPLSHEAYEDQANKSTNYALAYNPLNISTTLAPRREKVFCGSSKCSGNRFASPSKMCLSFTLTNPEKRPTHLLPSLLHLQCTSVHPASPLQHQASTQPTL